MTFLTDLDNTLFDSYKSMIENRHLFFSEINTRTGLFVNNNDNILKRDKTLNSKISTHPRYFIKECIEFIKQRTDTIHIITMRKTIDEYELKYVLNMFKIENIIHNCTEYDKVNYVIKNKPKFYAEDDPDILTQLYNRRAYKNTKLIAKRTKTNKDVVDYLKNIIVL
jgi:hypothetical protein